MNHQYTTPILTVKCIKVWRSSFDTRREEGFKPTQLKGILPKLQYNQDRIIEIADAIKRYTNAGEKIPCEWVDELAELI